MIATTVLVLSFAQAVPPTPRTVVSGTGTTTITGTAASAVRPSARWILTLGDSKTAQNAQGYVQWQVTLCASLTAASGATWSYENRGVGSQTTASYVAYAVAGNVLGPPALPVTHPAAVLINLGVNDALVGPFPTQAAWQADMLTLIDLVRAKWPGVAVYVMRWWSRTANQTNQDAEDGWMPAMVALRPRVYLGPDERVWLKGSDNGVTNTYDGTHQNQAGHHATAAAWKAVLWP